MILFPKKQLIQFSWTYWLLSFCKIFKKFLGPIQSFENVPFWTQNGPFVMNKTFLAQTIIITLIYLLALFIVQNLKKIRTVDPELWGCAIFGPKMVHLPQIIFFLGKLLISFYLPISPFHLAKFLKKFFLRIHSYKDVQLWGPKWPISRNENSFSENLLMSLVSFIHAYLHAKNQNQILIY